MFGGPDIFFSIFPLFFFLVFAVIIGGIIFTIAKGAKTWSHNNQQPKLTVDAKLISKRTNVSSHMSDSGDNISHVHSDTSYYLTFEVESGDRIEFHVSGEDFGLLVEGDRGRLTFQGTRYLGFSRNF